MRRLAGKTFDAIALALCQRLRGDVVQAVVVEIAKPRKVAVMPQKRRRGRQREQQEDVCPRT